MNKERIEKLLQPLADFMVEAALNIPSDELALYIIMSSLSLDEYLTKRDIFLQ